jgi:NADH-quinone oxidoreductase subunit A
LLSIWGAVLIFLVVGVIFGVGGMIAGYVLAPRRKSNQKSIAYECGVDTIGQTWVQFRTSYFLYALLFVIFDVEVIYLYPWAIKFQSLGLFAFVEMLVFLAILVVGLWYAWKEGAFEWT